MERTPKERLEALLDLLASDDPVIEVLEQKTEARLIELSAEQEKQERRAA